MSILLSKMTKNQLMEEYDKLLEKYDELKMMSGVVVDPQNVDLLSRVGGYTADSINQSITDLKNKVNDVLNETLNKLLSEAQKFGEIQKALELSKKNLELQYHIQVAAGTLEQLVNDNKTKKLEFEDEMMKKRRDWQREQEEFDYNVKVARKRDDNLYEENKKQKEKEFEEKELQLKNREEEWQRLKKMEVELPQNLEKVLAQKEQEVARRLNGEFDRRMDVLGNEQKSQKNIYELKLTHLEDQIKRQENEISALKQEAERANKKAQELAVKIVEGSARVATKSEEVKAQ